MFKTGGQSRHSWLDIVLWALKFMTVAAAAYGVYKAAEALKDDGERLYFKCKDALCPFRSKPECEKETADIEKDADPAQAE